MSEMLYQINPDRTIPWNNLPLLPIKEELFRTVEIIEKLGEAKASLARLQGRSAIIPNQGLLINTISLQEAKISSEIENIFTTDDELYKAFSDKNHETTGASKEVLRYREALWSGYNYLNSNKILTLSILLMYFKKLNLQKMELDPIFLILQSNKVELDLMQEK